MTKRTDKVRSSLASFIECIVDVREVPAADREDDYDCDAVYVLYRGWNEALLDAVDGLSDPADGSCDFIAIPVK
jgi:hypothetical protein